MYKHSLSHTECWISQGSENFILFPEMCKLWLDSLANTSKKLPDGLDLFYSCCICYPYLFSNFQLQPMATRSTRQKKHQTETNTQGDKKTGRKMYKNSEVYGDWDDVKSLQKKDTSHRNHFNTICIFTREIWVGERRRDRKQLKCSQLPRTFFERHADKGIMPAPSLFVLALSTSLNAALLRDNW